MFPGDAGSGVSFSALGTVLFLPQIPNIITLATSGPRYLLPLELAGWFLRKSGCTYGSNVLLVTDDKSGRLGAHLIVRMNPAVNVTCAVTSFAKSAVCLGAVLRVIVIDSC